MPPRLTTEQVRSRVRETDEGEYHLVGEYTSADRSITVLHEPCGRLIEVRAKGFLQEGDGRCRVCYPTAAKRGPKMTEAVFLERFAEQLGNEYELAGSFVSYKQPVSVRHTTCGTQWDITPHMLLGTKQRRCPVCANKGRGSHLRSPTYLADVLATQTWGDEYEWLEEYTGDNKAKLLIRHKTCEREYRVRPNDFQQGYQCPHCEAEASQSYGCKIIETTLSELGIEFARETTYDGLRHVGKLRFDFDVPLSDGHRLLIEYDGEQHFKSSGYITPQTLKKIQARDAAKNRYCADRPHLHLHRINYKQNVRNVLLEVLAQYFDLQ